MKKYPLVSLLKAFYCYMTWNLKLYWPYLFVFVVVAVVVVVVVVAHTVQIRIPDECSIKMVKMFFLFFVFFCPEPIKWLKCEF